MEVPLLPGRLEVFHAHARELAERGYGVLVAHPERSPELADDPLLMDEFVLGGRPLQVNASSLTGLHGDPAREVAMSLLASGGAAVLASDAHRPDRPPRLSDAIALAAHAGVDARPLAEDAPRRLLADGFRPRRANAVEASARVTPPRALPSDARPGSSHARA